MTAAASGSEGGSDMVWIVSILAMFLVYMLLDSWLAEYHSFKMMEYARYLEWKENKKAGE